MLYGKQNVYFNKATIDGRIHNGTGTTKANDAKDSNIDEKITKFQDQLKNEYVHRIPLKYFIDLGKNISQQK